MDVQYEPVPNEPRRRRDLGLGLCLSGGGYRAMLFHAGALARLNELGILHKLDAVSSVSGGSIAAGILASFWTELNWNRDGVATNFDPVFLERVLKFAQKTTDFHSIAVGLLVPWTTASKETSKLYRDILCPGANLNNLPDSPRFVFCASNLTTGSLFRFSKRYIADYRLGQHFNPNLELATVVAASAAFPPALSPLRLDLRPFKFEMRAIDGRVPPPPHPTLLKRAVLSDGGVYDNHGLQPLIHRCRTLLVSDGGAPWSTSTKGLYCWISQLKRVAHTTDNQVRALRREDLMGRFIGSREAARLGLSEESAIRQYFSLDGTFWSISTDPSNYPVRLGKLYEQRWRELAGIGTWLHFLGERQTEDLVNWGYVVSDLAIRSYVMPDSPACAKLPVRPHRVKAGLAARITKWFGERLSVG